MFATNAWQRHGCYHLGSEQYFNMPLQKSLIGCLDDWNSLDHFDPTADSRRLTAQMYYLRNNYGALQDGWGLTQLGNWTYVIQRPGSNGTSTEMGLWTASRSFMDVQNKTGAQTTDIFILYTNENTTNTYAFDCSTSLWISSPFAANTIVRNLFYPFENYTLQTSGQKTGNLTTGCLNKVTMDPYSFKALVPAENWIAPRPALTKFSPGHDTRINSDNGTTTVDVRLEFNVAMDCAGVSKAIALNMSSSGNGSAPTFNAASASCGAVSNPDATVLPGDTPSAWFWQTTLTNVPDGILQITIDNAPSATTGVTTGVRVFIIITVGERDPDALHRPSTSCSSARASR
jgi:alpha-1,3-glucan synthase